MRSKLALSGVVALMYGVITPLQAEESFYLGFKGGSVLVDVDGFSGHSAATMVSGYRFAWLQLEGQFSNNLSEGSTPTPGVTWNSAGIGLYGAYRTPGDLFFKVRGGFIDTSIDFHSGTGSVGGTIGGGESSGSLSIGGGYRLGEDHWIEIEYTTIQSDLNYVTVGYYF